MAPLSRLMTPEEVARYLGLSKKSIYRLLESGQLIGCKFGRVWRIKEEDLMKYVELHRGLLYRRIFRPEVLIKYFQAPHKYQVIKRGSIGWLMPIKAKRSERIKYQQITLPNSKRVILVTPRYFACLPKSEQTEWQKFEILL